MPAPKIDPLVGEYVDPWPRWRWGVWAAVVLLVAGGFIYKAWLRKEYRADIVATNANVLAEHVNTRRLEYLLGQSSDAVAAAMADIGPLRQLEVSGRGGEIVELTDGAHACKFDLVFSAGRMRAITVIPMEVKQPWYKRWDDMGAVIRGVAEFAGAGWLVLAATALIATRHRRRFAECSLAAAVIWGALYLVNADPDRIFYFAARDAMHWLALMGIMVSLGLLRVVKDARFGPGGNRCRRCEYDLRGNESGICPECGRKAPPKMDVDPDVVAQRLGEMKDEEFLPQMDTDEHG